MIRFILIAVGLVVLGAGAAIFFILNDRTDLDPYAGLFVDEPAKPGKVHVTSAGIATLVITDGETTLMTDGFFTRPGMLDMLSDIAPDEARIDAALKRLGVSKAAAIIPLHSHYDHAMDSPLVAQKTGAVLLGSPSSANVGRGAGLAEDRIIEAEYGTRYRFGSFTVEFYPSTHVPLPNKGMTGPIDQPLTAPAPVGAYKQGKAYSVVIRHDSGTSLLVQGSAGYSEGALEGLDLDAVFLGAGGLGLQSADYVQTYWAELVTRTNPELVVPIHWDDLFGPLDADLESSPRMIDNFGTTLDFMLYKANEEGRAVKLLQGFSGVTLD